MPAQQARVFLAMALCGAAVACACDGARALRRLLGLGDVLSGALDLAMGALSAAAMALTALRLRIDPLRLYAFAGVAAGFALYRVSAGALVRHADARIRSHMTRKAEDSSGSAKLWSKNGRKGAKACRKTAD